MGEMSDYHDANAEALALASELPVCIWDTGNRDACWATAGAYVALLDIDPPDCPMHGAPYDECQAAGVHVCSPASSCDGA